MINASAREKILKGFLLLYCVSLAGELIEKFDLPTCMASLFTIPITGFLLFLFFFPVILITEFFLYMLSPSFKKILTLSGKDVLRYPFAKKMFFKDFYYWILAYIISFHIINNANTSEESFTGPFFLLFTCAYLCAGLFKNIKKDREYYLQREEEFTRPPAEKPAFPAERTFPAKQNPWTEQPALPKRYSRIKTDNPEIPVIKAERQVLPKRYSGLQEDSLDIIAIRLVKISKELEDEDLVSDIHMIVKRLKMIKEFIMTSPEDAACIKCRQETCSYASELYEMLVKYDKVENSRLNTAEVIATMSSIRSFTKELNFVFEKILESAVAPKLLESKSRIDALRNEIRLKGLSGN